MVSMVVYGRVARLSPKFLVWGGTLQIHPTNSKRRLLRRKKERKFREKEVFGKNGRISPRLRPHLAAANMAINPVNCQQKKRRRKINKYLSPRQSRSELIEPPRTNQIRIHYSHPMEDLA
ncbi:hypothetical protein H6P81_009608 [Aristolochia fimbriata]|uniref:Ribosomal protein S4 n=1 Tax=Aristolochia fimbriata TaxID=158543 RepID=A0AAV7EQU2_ARIFI|nr:hypothetical protein H6P81_009608 [Aristolochia fimbriata]